jgi:hypothetical protein
MKRFSVMVLVMVLGLVLTQDLHPKRFGIKSGANFANVYNVEDSLDYKTRTGFIIGGFYRFDLNNHLAIQPEAYYSMKGTKVGSVETYEYLGGTVTEAYDYNLKLNYLEIPVLLKYKIPTRGKLKPNLFLGPCMAFKLSARLTGSYKYEENYAYPGESGYVSYTGNIDEELDEVKTTDFGLIIGAGVDIEMGSSSLVIEARYNWGLTGLSKFADASDPGAKNAAFTLMMGIAFN